MTPARSAARRTTLGRSTLPAALAALALAFTAAPARADEGGSWLHYIGANMIVGSGKLQSETRAISGFQAVSLRGSINLVLRQGTHDAVEVRGDDNLLAMIETRLVDRGGVPTLEIDMKHGSSYRTRGELTATVDVVALHDLSVSGSGDVRSEGLKTDALKVGVSGSGDVRLRQLSAGKLSIRISGSGDVDVKGHGAKLDVAIAGSGDVDTSGLDADDVSVSIAGSGDASVNARKTLWVSIAGSGDVAYTGDAVLKSSVAGSGSVTKH